MKIDIQPYLAGELVTLKALSHTDFDQLFSAASDPLIWEQHQDNYRHTPDGFTKFFEESILSQGALSIRDNKNDLIIGSSRFKIINKTEAVVEIGWTFLTREYWGGSYNGEVKKLMINYALRHFNNVVFYVDSQNRRSQRALEKLGAIKMSNSNLSWVLDEELGLTYLIKTEIQ